MGMFDQPQSIFADPSAFGAADQASGPLAQALGQLLTQHAQGLPQSFNDLFGQRGPSYDPALTASQNMQNMTTPEARQQAMDIAMGFTGGGLGIKAYHGSPHDFNAFDASKIGTGEGAQAYGHGLYFAESEPVARAYRQNLAQGSYLTPGGLANYGDVHTRMADAAKAAAGLHPDQARQVANYVLDGIDVYGSPAAYLKQYEFPGGKFGDAYRAAANAVPDIRKNPGSMYEVNINADPNAFLNWDKPLSEQPEAVRQALPNVASWGQHYIPTSLEGGVIAPRTPEAARQFAEGGIPGIKYLDQGSRGAGEGTNNYVVFDPSIIEILRKYGIMGPAVGGAGYGMFGQPQQ